MLKIKGEKGLEIYFNNDNPQKLIEDVDLRGLEGKELKEALNKPFVVTESIEILIVYEGKHYYFTIPKGYRHNGANVPPFAWVIIGQQKEPRFKLPSCIHDYLCDTHSAVDNNRYLSTLIFITLCEYFGKFNKFKCWAMKHSVDNWQKFCGWGK